MDDITLLSRDIAVVDSSQVVVVVWVVNATSLKLTSAPAESCVAGCAVHLVAAVNLENPRGTLGTRPGVLGEQTSRLDILWLALVLVISLDLVTGWTNLGVTHATLPPGRQETATVFGRTSPNKLAPRTCRRGAHVEDVVVILEIHTFTIDNITFCFLFEIAPVTSKTSLVVHTRLVQNLILLIENFSQHSILFPNLLADVAHLFHTLGSWLRRRHQGSLTLEQNILTAFLERLADKLFGKVFHQLFTVPTRLAAHAVRVVWCVEQILFGTGRTLYKLAVVARNL